MQYRELMPVCFVASGTILLGYLDAWTDDPSREGEGPKYDAGAVLSSATARAISSYTTLVTKQEVEDLRRQATVRCGGSDFKSCRPLRKPCIFDVVADPCERLNLYAKGSETLQLLEAEMMAYRRTAVKPNNRRSDKFANPKYWNNTWTFWKDLPVPSVASQGKEAFSIW
jgi:hypothetical protein